MGSDDLFDDLFDLGPAVIEELVMPTIPMTSEIIDAPTPTPLPARMDDAGFLDIIFDIETGPRPWPEIETFFQPVDQPGSFDPASVKYGNCKDEGKRREKFEAAQAKHAEAVANWEAENAKAKAEFLAKAALSPLTGQVIAIGYLRGKEATIIGVGQEEADGQVWQEAGLLWSFWAMYRQAASRNCRMIGFNIFGFDLPFLIRRSWLLGVDVPRDVLREHRYWAKTFIDLMQAWGCGIYGERCSLDKVNKFFGGSGKNGNGAEFAGLWMDEATREQAAKYLENDLEMTAMVARKMGVI